MIIISACLLGVKCRYDGRSSPDEALAAIYTTRHLVPLCPEQLGGLSTPRNPSSIISGDGDDVLAGRSRIVDSQGNDVTEQFLRGAHETLRIATILGVDTAILKEKSPSCGVHCIKRDDIMITGTGVTASLLRRHGIRIISSERIHGNV